jgi:hypothetical protein
METVISSPVDQEFMTCAFLVCGPSREYDLDDGWESSALLGFLVVLAVRVLFLVGEHAVLLRTISYYKRVNSVASLATHSTLEKAHRVRSLSTSVDQGVGSEIAVETELNFKREVRELLSGNNTWTTYVLIMTTFVQLVYWFRARKRGGGIH